MINIRYCLLLLCLLTFFDSQAQRKYAINSQGSVCYFHFICYAPNNNYINVKRPFIIIIGKPGETIEDTYTADSLKDIPQFFNFMLVYVPNTGKTPAQKLECIEALVSSLTYNYTFGRSNLFLQVKDKEINQSDINSFALNTVFKSVRLDNNMGADSLSLAKAKSNITMDFVESVTAYEADVESEDDKYGTFYQEEENEKETSQGEIKSQKVYFGPPQEFKFTLTGLIRDRSTGEALPFANVMIKGTNIGTTTNADGYFTLQKIPSDTSVIIAQYVGYEKTEIFLTPMTVKKNLLIEIRPSGQNLKTVTVTGYKEDVVLISKTDVSVLKMTLKVRTTPKCGRA